MRTRKISKGQHEHRTVYCPSPDEKNRLRSFLPELSKIERDMAAKFLVSHVAHAFVANRNQVTCAMRHIGFPATYCFDLKSWFNSITIKQLIDAGVPEHIAIEITVDGHLPQGFPTSPVAANIVGVRFDRQVIQRLNRMEDRYGKYSYTRYADDLQISWADDENAYYVAQDAVRGPAESLNWQLHKSKNAYYRAASGKRIICGIAVDHVRVGPTRHTKRKLRAARKNARGSRLSPSVARLRNLESWAACKLPKRCRKSVRLIPGVSMHAAGGTATNQTPPPMKAICTPGSSRRLYFGGNNDDLRSNGTPDTEPGGH